MTEGLASPGGKATAAHQRLYASWAKGGAALLFSGNIMIDRRYRERAGNVVVEDDTGLDALKAWAEVVRTHGSQLWAQLSHPGRQCPRLVTPTPWRPLKCSCPWPAILASRAMTETDVLDVIARFAHTASVAKDSGFGGVQIHAAHGYLLSQFLSPRTNRRTDRWGGSLENRARLLPHVVDAIRASVGTDFPIAVKLNSSDLVQGGFNLDESIQVVRWLSAAGIDLLEISGGTYEQLEFFKAHDPNEIRDSTRQREAMFLKYAKSIKAAANMPVMITGGFRTLAGMETALHSGDTDIIGIARSFCLDPDFPARMLAGSLAALPVPEDRLVLGKGWRGPNSKSVSMRAFNNQAQAGWYYHQIERLGAGLAPQPGLSPWSALLGHFWRDFGRAMARKLAAARATKRASPG